MCKSKLALNNIPNKGQIMVPFDSEQNIKKFFKHLSR